MPCSMLINACQELLFIACPCNRGQATQNDMQSLLLSFLPPSSLITLLMYLHLQKLFKTFSLKVRT